MYVVGRKVAVLNGGVIPLAFPGFLADHGSNAVLTESVGIGHIVFELPVNAAVFLVAATIGVVDVRTEFCGRLKSIGLGTVNVKTKFRTPCKVLEESNIRENITVQGLPGKKYVIEHCLGNGVDNLVVRHLDIGIVTVKVIDRGAGK